MNHQYEIGIVIVTWNGLAHLERLFPSLFMQDTDKKYKIVVVNNGSTDGTKDYILDYPEIDYIELSKNEGFAEPNNIGIRHLFSKYPSIEKIVFLNNDTVVPKTFISTLLSGFDSSLRCVRHSFSEGGRTERGNPGLIATVQTKIVSFDNPKIIDSVGILVDESMSAINKGQGETDIGQYNEACEIFGTTASAMMISKEALQAVDLSNETYFDPLYFAYQEDVDLAWRLRLLGFTSQYISGEPVLHVHSATGQSYSAFKSFHIHRNTLFTIVKNMPFSLVFKVLGLFCMRYIHLVLSVFRKRGPSYEVSKKTGIFAMMWSVVVSWLSLLWYVSELIKKRSIIQKKRKISINDTKEIFHKFKANKQKIIYGTRS